MSWKNFATWYKGAIDGLIIGFMVSVGFIVNNPILNSLASPGLYSCRFLTQCIGDICQGCIIIGLLFNLIYGFLIGALIGWLIERGIKGRKDKIRKRKRR